MRERKEDGRGRGREKGVGRERESERETGEIENKKGGRQRIKCANHYSIMKKREKDSTKSKNYFIFVFSLIYFTFYGTMLSISCCIKTHQKAVTQEILSDIASIFFWVGGAPFFLFDLSPNDQVLTVNTE